MPSRVLWGSCTWRPFCAQFLIGKTPASMTFSEFHTPKQLLIKGRAANEPFEARLRNQRGSSRLGNLNTYHRRPCTQTYPLETLQKNARLLLPWFLSDTPSWLHNLSLFIRECGHSSWGISVLCSPFVWQRNKVTLSLSSITVSVLLFGIGAELCGSLDGTGAWERMDTCICMAESLRNSAETTTLLIGYTPIQYKKFKNSKKNFGRKMRWITSMWKH